MKNKIVLITGATSGIGRACAHKFASMGADIILNGRKVELMEEIKNELVALGVDVLLLPFDVRDREAMRAAVDSLEGKWKNIDVLINNAGLVFGVDKEFEGSLDEWDIMIDTNIRALLAMTRMVVPAMVERGAGHIINIGSVFTSAGIAGNGNISIDTFRTIYITGLPYDIVHAFLAAFCMYVVGNPMIRKIERIKIKYGIYK